MRVHFRFVILATASLSTGLAACSKTGAPAVPGSAAAAGAYEVVTVERPESVAAFHQLYKGTYAMCAHTREVLKRSPAPPMLQPPEDYVTKRMTYTSDGTAYLVATEYYFYKIKMEEPELSCATYREVTSETQLVRNGKTYYAHTDEHGKRTAEVEDAAAVPRSHRDEVFTMKKIVKGQAVKCMPMLPNTAELMTESCIADLNPGTLYDAGGEPITLASRVTSTQKLAGAILVEPLSVKVGQKIDPALFDAAAR